jgi:hypothetical protein
MALPAAAWAGAANISAQMAAPEAANNIRIANFLRMSLSQYMSLRFTPDTLRTG